MLTFTAEVAGDDPFYADLDEDEVVFECREDNHRTFVWRPVCE